MKKRISGSFLAVGLGLSIASAQAADIRVRVNGEPVQFTGMGPQQVEGRVMVPLRGVLEKLGAFVDWVPRTQTVVASRGSLDMQLQIGSRTARVNGRDVPLDVPAMTMGGSTMVPLRFVGETLGADVKWDGPNQTVMITTTDSGGTTNPRGNDPVDGHRNDPPPVRVDPRITVSSITHNRRNGWLRPGDSLDVTMRGTPGAEGTFRVPGLVDQVRMRETSPGIYEGSWIVPANKDLHVENAAVLGSLRMPGGNAQDSPLIQAGDTLQIDTTAPVIDDLNPAPKDQVQTAQPLISATISDRGGSGIAPDKMRIMLDGRDITQDATITGQFFTYKPSRPLTARDHVIDVAASDRAGNEVHRSWDFSVAQTNTSTRRGIENIETNAAGNLRVGDAINVRTMGEPGSVMSFTLGPVRNVPMRETQPGVYTGTYRLRQGDDMDNARLSVTMRPPNGKRITQTHDRAATVRTGPPTAPVITYPGPNDPLSSPLVIRGTGQPRSTVRVKIDYTSKVLGVFGVKGTAGQVDAIVDKSGKWETKPIDLSSLAGRRDTQYTVTAVAVNALDEQSQPVTTRFR